MASPNLFLEKLSPELRWEIYSHIFSSSNVIKPSSSNTALGIRNFEEGSYNYRTETTASEQTHDVRLDTSILAVNKLVFLEAIPVLYGQHTIRGTTRDFRRLLQNVDFVKHVKQIEIADCIGCYQDNDFYTVLERLQILSKVHSLKILSDCLDKLEHTNVGRIKSYSVPRFCIKAQLPEVTCIDIGRYQLHGSLHRYQFVNRRLLLLWPEVRSTPADYDAYKDYLHLRAKWPSQGNDLHFMSWCLQTSLRCWVGVHDWLVSMAVSGELYRLDNLSMEDGADKYKFLQHFADTTRHVHFNARDLIEKNAHQYKREPAACLLRKLTPADDAETLCWATKHLSANIVGHYAYDNDEDAEKNAPPRYLTKSHWAKCDGGMHTIEKKAMHQIVARAGLPDSQYIRNPVRHSQLYVTATVIPRIVDGCFFGGILTTSNGIDGLDDIEIRQLAYFVYGNRSLGIPSPPAQPPARRYISASGSFTQLETDTLRHTSLDDLRKIMTKVIWHLADGRQFVRRIIQQKAPRMSTYAPEDLDEDLFEPFAWLQGPFLKYAWIEYQKLGDIVLTSCALERGKDQSTAEDVGSTLFPFLRNSNW